MFLCAAGSDQERCPVGWAGTHGECSQCAPGQDTNVERTVCIDCRRYTYNPDGLGCAPCPRSQDNPADMSLRFAPNAQSGAQYCVPCSLQASLTNDPGYATVDWDSCTNENLVVCEPGQQLTNDLTGCEQCVDQGESRYSPTGVRCEICDPGKQPNADRTACGDCDAGSYSAFGICHTCESLAATNNSFYAAPGAVRCLSCGPGKQPNQGPPNDGTVARVECKQCIDGWFSSEGVCSECPPGTQSSRTRTSCDECRDSGLMYARNSSQGRCDRCPNGQAPLPGHVGCGSCPLTQLGREGQCWDACSALGCSRNDENGVARPSWDMFIPRGEAMMQLNALTDVCQYGIDWVTASTGISVSIAVDSSEGTCTNSDCNMRLPEGTRTLSITAQDDRTTQVCTQTVEVIAASISIDPPTVEAYCESTEYIDTPISLTNSGGQSATLFRIDVDGWLAVYRVADCAVAELANTLESVEFPQTLAPGEFLSVILRSSGASAAAGLNTKNATIVSSTGDTTFQVNLNVGASGLRVVSLPDILPQSILRAGRSESTFVTVYNSDPHGKAQWSISNCTNFVGLAPGGLPPFSFSRCGGWENNAVLGTPVQPDHMAALRAVTYWRVFEWVHFDDWKITEAYLRLKGDVEDAEVYLYANIDKNDQFWRPNGLLEVAEQAQVEVKYTAPMQVGEYRNENIIFGASVTSWWSDPLPADPTEPPLTFSVLPPTEWIMQSSILVVPDDINPATSTNFLERDITAGQSTKLWVVPRDQFSNEIYEFGMSFASTVTRRSTDVIAGVSGDAEYIFESYYNPDNRYKYSITLTMPIMGPWLIVTKYGAEVVPPSLFPVVLTIVCTELGDDVVSFPNEAGTDCLCGDGYARTAGRCARCPPGSRPKVDREQGCDSCSFQPGTVSADGRSCVECESGLRPNSAADTCIPCPENQYYDIVTQVCKACLPGNEIVRGQGLPCQLCHEGSAGIDGTCDDCPDGFEPTENKQLCKSCDTGSAGQNGACEECAPGKHQKADQTDCLDCPIGSFRNAEVRATCIRCDKDDEMVTQPAAGTGAISLADCICPPGEYDLLDNPLGEGLGNAGQLDATGEYWVPLANIVYQDEGDPVGFDAIMAVFSTVSDTTAYLSGGNSTDAPVKSWPLGISEDDIRGNPIFCFPDGRVRIPYTIKENKESTDDLLMKQRCIRCPECLDCDFPGWAGMPFIKQNWTFVEDNMLDQYDKLSVYAGCPEVGEPMPDALPAGHPRAGTGVSLAEICADPKVRESVALPISAAGFARRDAEGESTYLEQNLDVGHFFELPEGESALWQAHYREPGRERNVLGCPYEFACNAELDYRNVSGKVERCGVGYSGPMCGFCAAGYAMKKTGCIYCQSAGILALQGTFIVFGIIFFFKWLLPRLIRNDAVREIVHVIGRVLPAMMKDIKIVMQVYQIFAAMGMTLNVKFPVNVEEFISVFKEYVSLDIFQLPGVGCMAPSNYYMKFYSQLAFPMGICAYFVFDYFKKCEEVDELLRDAGHAHDKDADAKLKDKLKDEHKVTRKKGPLSSRPREGADDGPNTDEMTQEQKDKEAAKQERAMLSKMGMNDDDDEMSQQESQARYERLQRKANLKQKCISHTLLVLFLAFPGITNKIFGFFMCYKTGIQAQQYMVEDFAQSCNEDLYYYHTFLLAALIFAIPLGIPFMLIRLLLSHGNEIRMHEGPHELEALYIDYKPDCFLWDCYQMLQKVALIGLLTFIDYGSILQSIIGLFISLFYLMALLKYRPYESHRSNLLSYLGQAMIVISYLSAVMMRVDLEGEKYLTNTTIGMVMLLANLPMLLYLVFDSIVTIKDELHHVRIDIIKYELGKIGNKYVCVDEAGVAVHRKMIRDKPVRGVKPPEPVGRIKVGEFVTVNAQAIIFEHGGAVARLHKQKRDKGDISMTGEDLLAPEDFHGWFSYNHHGILGKRHFKLADEDEVEGDSIGKLHVEMRRFHERFRCNVLKIDWREHFLVETVGEVADEEERAVKIYLELRVNREKKFTAVTDFMSEDPDSKGPSWNQGVGQALLYDVTDPDDVDGNGLVECIVIKCYMGDPDAKPKEGLTEEEDDDFKSPRLLGVCYLDLEDRITQDDWEWDLLELDAVDIRKEMRQLTEDEMEEKAAMAKMGLTWRPSGPKAAKGKNGQPEGKSLSEELHHQAQLAKLRNGDVEAPKYKAGVPKPSLASSLQAAATAQKIKAGKEKSDPTLHIGNYRAVKMTPLQRGAEVTSNKQGQLKAGEVVEVTETKVLKDGTLRLRVGRRGWVSKTSAQGFAQLHRVKMQHRVAEDKGHHLKDLLHKKEKKKKPADKGTVANPMFAE